MVKRFLAYLKGWRGIALTAYMWLILMGWAVMYVDMTSPTMKKRMYFISVLEMTLVIALLVCPRLLRWAESLTLQPNFSSFTAQERRKFFLRTWLRVFLVFLAVYIFFYPGGMNADNVNQYGQALSGCYHDHNPVFHTLFSFTLPLKLTGGWFGSIALFQIIIFSFSLAYMAYTLYEYGSYLFAKRFLIFTVLNPATLGTSVVPVKDLAFAVASMLMMTFAVRVHFTGGKWLASLRNMAVFVFVAASGTIFRHNGVLFTLPLFLAMFFYVDKKKVLAMLLCFAGLIYAVRGPMYDALKVQRADNIRQIDALGLPMTIIGNAVKEAPECLDDEIIEFAHTVAPQEIWEKCFDVFRGWDDIKYLKGSKLQYISSQNFSEKDIQAVGKVDIYAVERVSWKKIVIMALRCFREAPFEALRGALGITAINYGILGSLARLGDSGIPVINENNLGVRNNNFFRLNFLTNFIRNNIPENVKTFKEIRERDITLQSLLIFVEVGIIILLKPIFWHIGVINLIVIVFILARLKFNRAYDWKRLCLVLPLLIHNFGTMLLLMAPVFRYFYVSYLVFPLIILVLMRGKEDN